MLVLCVKIVVSRMQFSATVLISILGVNLENLHPKWMIMTINFKRTSHPKKVKHMTKFADINDKMV